MAKKKAATKKKVPKKKRPKKTLTEPKLSPKSVKEVSEYLEWFDALPVEIRRAATNYNLVKKWRRNL